MQRPRPPGRAYRVTRIITLVLFALVVWKPPFAEAPLAPEIILPTPVQAAAPVGSPRQLAIRGQRVVARVADVGVLPDGKLDVPPSRRVLGWWNGGPRPGEQGNAVIDGHLNLAG